jgi:transposase
VESLRKGISNSETARRFDVNRWTVQRYIKQLDEEDSLAPKQRPGSRPKLDESALLLLEQDLESRPWATHRQRSEFLYEICGVEVSEATICRAIKRGLSHSRKKDQQGLASGTSG